ncbi:aldehyde dehydrogenase family protein [Paraburkholderia tagetis]|uniref:Aldehyde dehydrogenase family protein n=1 Tax=Paraburkholderia tagetis TaxID=2913261 RepID=A0A9X1ZYL2_9BURK|nr:aldehyde dehydrogenase family protein [Paraburkholderia tagetis]MCG5077449.1 aldehyde dehydrogenase family protein [Paraburkholderia tagetis]
MTNLNELAATLRLPVEPIRSPMFIDGKEYTGNSGEFVARKSPGHGVPVTSTVRATVEDLNAAVASARRASDDGRWSRLSGEQRATVLLKAAQLIRDNVETLTYLETLESGKPIGQSRGEIGAAAGIWEYAAGLARVVHGDTHDTLGGDLFGLVVRQPIGVVGIVTPWNFPFFILSERLPFVLAAGCTAVVKPAELTSSTTLKLAALLIEAGLPDGVVNVVTGLGSVVGQALAEHMDVDMISFTGSTPVGRSVLAAAGGNMKKVGLELGGKNPQIVFADADLDDAADAIAFGIAFNAGQCCVSGSRLVVHRSVEQQLVERVKAVLEKVRVGDPLDAANHVGAIVEARQFDKIRGFINAGRRDGAQLVCGGTASNEGERFFIEPTVFRNVQPQSALAQEEIFGPVLSVTPFDTFEEAIQLANGVPYGLAASIWTRDLQGAIKSFREVQAGRIWVNCTITGGPEMPIGGVKQSGIGRETGRYGLEEYTELKSVHIQVGSRPRWIA